MAKIPYLIRRGNVFHFRLAVPGQIQDILGRREITQSLFTESRRIAAPRALLLSAKVKTIFNDAQSDMAENKKSLKDLVRDTRHKVEKAMLREGHEKEIVELHRERIAAVDKARLEATVEAQQAIIAGHSAAPEQPAQVVKSAAPKLSKVIDRFLKVKASDPEKAMYAKHKTTLPLFLEIVGNKPVSELKQSDINNFFAIVEKLPPRWSDRKKKGESVRQLVKMEHETTIGKGTFENTYRTCVGQFLQDCVINHQDNGFPVTLTVSGIKYRGKGADKGENRQRAFKPDELKRLFEGSEMQSFAADKEGQGKYWLCHIGLFTGARVNEVCQLNPQCDIVQEEGVWVFKFDENTEGDERIEKSTKNKSSCRTVPIHSKLIELGFLDYWEGVKAAGHKLIFPEFKPSKGRASGSGEKWFRRHLEAVKLRDDSPGARLVGYHAFRHTLLNRAKHLKIQGIEAITGHVDASKSAVVRGYEGASEIGELQAIIEQIRFDVEFIGPAN